MAIHIGTSGWSYSHWDTVVYPAGTPARDRLGHYCRLFSTAELNSSFYHWPRRNQFPGWRRRLPADFTLSVKAPLGLTHAKRLYAPEKWIERIAVCWHELGRRRGALLVQLPPDQSRDDDRLRYFLELLPAWLHTAIEFRHPSWLDDAVFALLERHQTGYCVMSGARLPCVLRVTAPFVYVRLHGPDPEQLYSGCYSDADLDWWAARIHEWAMSGKDVFVYFNNDGHGFAVRNAQTLRGLLLT